MKSMISSSKKMAMIYVMEEKASETEDNVSIDSEHEGLSSNEETRVQQNLKGIYSLLTCLSLFALFFFFFCSNSMVLALL